MSESPNVVKYTISENQNDNFSVSENQNADDSMPTSQNQNAEDTGIKLKGKFMTTEKKKLIHTLTSEKATHTEVQTSIKEDDYFGLDHKDNLDRQTDRHLLKE